jgi:hypothetical protein
MLPNDTKYKVADALENMTSANLVPILQAMGLEMERLDITRVERLYFTIRIKPLDGGAPRHIAVRISEPW